MSLSVRILLLGMPTLWLSACLSDERIAPIPNPAWSTPSPLPRIVTPTPIVIVPPTHSAASPSPTVLTPSSSPSPLPSDPSPSPTATTTPTASSLLSPTPTSLPLQIRLLSCDTSLDITHGMGEVTNAYVTLINASGPDLSAVCATLFAPDEGRVHPDKTVCFPSLPGGFQVTLKLTVDTTFQADTHIRIEVISNQGLVAQASGLRCQAIGLFRPAPDPIGVVQPIP